MRKNDEILNELNRYLKTPSITFERGLMQTDNDSMFGYVSNIKNMTIEDNSIERRKGSKFLSDPDITNKYIFLEELTISGVHILFAINEHREVSAMIEQWEEQPFTVWKKGLFELPENLGDGFQFKFSRGQKFWVIEDNKYYKIINDFGDACRINKHGYIQFAKTANVSPQYFYPQETIEDARDEDFKEIGLFLELTDVSHKPAPQFTFVKDSTGQTPELRGDVRVASVNEAGHTGLWSDPHYLMDWRSVYVSKSKGIMFEYDTIEESSKMVNAGFMTTKSAIVPCVSASSLVLSNGSLNTEYLYKKQSVQSPHLEKRQVTILWDSSNRKLMLYADNDFGIGDSLIGIKDPFAIIKNMEFLTKTSASGANLSLVNYKKKDAFDVTGQVNSVTDAELPDDYTGWNGSILTADNASTKKMITIEISKETNDLIEKRIGSPQSCFISGLTITKQFFGAIGIATLDLTHGTVATSFYKANTIFTLNEDADYILQSENIRFMKDLGLDLWFSKAEVSNIFSSFKFIRDNSLYFDTISTDELIALREEDLSDSEGFAVWNDGFIKGKSQKFLQTTNSTLEPRYSFENTYDKDINSSHETGRVINQTPYEVKSGLMPIISMRDTKLTRSYHEVNLMTETIKQPKHIVSNSGKIFVVQGQRLWIGNEETLILESNIDVDFTIEHMQPLASGVVAMTTKGLRFIDSKGDISFVSSTKINSERFKTSTHSGTGVFAISTTDEVVFIHMVYGVNTKPYAEAISLSQAIYTI